MLIEIEGASPRVAVIGTTSRPDILDKSLLRTGRLDLMLYAAPPDEKNRLEIIKKLTAKMPLADNTNLGEIASATKNYTGADIASLCREAAVSAIKANSDTITVQDFAHALRHVGPSITEEISKWYDAVREGISNVMLPPQGNKPAFYG